jgi:fructosamine-3-kinase
MNIKSNLQSEIESVLNESITSSNSVSGGCIADSKLIETESGKRYFAKTYAAEPKMFFNEANGLNELAKANAIEVPKVIKADKGYLLLGFIETGNKPRDFFETFGREFARMHRYTSESFGFYEDNFIGATPQYNIAEGSEKTSWAEFYYQKRILAQYKIAEQRGFATNELHNGVMQLENKIESILKGSTEAPALLHGDLWNGNYMCSKNGKAVLIDPAVYYGHREADLAMTKMFGGFSHDFYKAYQEEYPLPKGWQYRENLYLLYHYMNHMNLFGMSYYSQSVNLLWGYLG